VGHLRNFRLVTDHILERLFEEPPPVNWTRQTVDKVDYNSIWSEDDRQRPHVMVDRASSVHLILDGRYVLDSHRPVRYTGAPQHRADEEGLYGLCGRTNRFRIYCIGYRESGRW
jgi:hypothetical protein